MISGEGKYFIAYEDLTDTPNIIVDGAASDATAITLSHWPKSGTPYPLKADSSAEIVFNYLDSPDFHVDAKAISNNHFDQDGLVGIYSLLNPAKAIAMRDLLIDIAQAGDFVKYHDRQAARVAFIISSFTHQDMSPLDPEIFEMDPSRKCAALYRALLPMLELFISDTENYQSYWEKEDRWLEESERAISRGIITIRELNEYELAVVSLPENWTAASSDGTLGVDHICHPMAINNKTDCNRVLIVRGHQYALLYRYESWVQYISKPTAPRVDLTKFAEELTAQEPAGAIWTFDGIEKIYPVLAVDPEEESLLEPNQFLARLIKFLETNPGAWDPYDEAD